MGTWRKSTYSGANGGDCVEVADIPVRDTRWRKSTHSGANGGECIEVGDSPRTILVRDTKQEGRANRTTLAVTPAAWRKFTASLR